MIVRSLSRLTLALLGLFSLTMAQARQADAPAPPPAAAPADADPALWVVKDKDTTIYLFGSVHVLKPGLSWFDEAVRKAFDRSDQLVLEVVLPDNPAEIQGSVLKAALNTSGPALSDKLNDDERKAYQAALADYGMPGNALDRFDPWFAALTLTQLAVKKAGFDAKDGVEATLTAAAKAAGKPVAGLETVDQQFGYLDSLDAKTQIVMLDSTVKDLPQTGPKIDAMIADWSRGKADSLAALINQSELETPALFKTLLADRNARWAKWIDERMEKPGTVFIAVGAGHLAGKDSVQEQLRAYHLKAKRVRY